MRHPFHPLAVLSFFAACCSSANADILINPILESSITSNPNAAKIEAGIDQAISNIESFMANPITVSVDFGSMNTGLGQSSTLINDLSYSQYRSDLANNQILSSNDSLALASLPVASTNPVNGNAAVVLTLPNLRAIGETALGNKGGGFDSTIRLNLSDMNLSRTGPQDPTKYDLQAVTTHEIDEVLGIGGTGSRLSASGPTVPTDPVGSLDLFRFASSSGARSFTTSASATAYFSINSGAKNLTTFNQNGSGDFGDWATGPTPQVQDAFGTRSVDVNLGPNELTALDVIGYNLVAVPEPGSEQSLGNKLTKSLHVLVDGGHLWPLAEQVLEPTPRSTAKEQRTKSGKERSRVAHAYIRIYTYQKSSFLR